MSLIQAQGLGVRIGSRQVLRNVDLSVRRREIVTIVGPNGSGKTTLLRALIGAQTLSEGVVIREAELRVGYVPQRLAIDQVMPLTVARWLALSGIRDR
ncbi:MAG: ATP-binding cassette domain-containing protein, partial [Gammaproteobacteria bacterium]|nr:ATP-binding cassette domain-containing protein [Gammaproteobacteria bacterium]